MSLRATLPECTCTFFAGIVHGPVLFSQIPRYHVVQNWVLFVNQNLSHRQYYRHSYLTSPPQPPRFFICNRFSYPSSTLSRPHPRFPHLHSCINWQIPHAFFLPPSTFAFFAAFFRLLLIMTTLKNEPTTALPKRMRITGMRIAHTLGGKRSWRGCPGSTNG